MARMPRLFVPGCPQHIIQRGNNRQVCFFTDKDYPVYLNKLKEVARLNRVAIHAFVLMTNHVHLLVSTDTQQAISNCMQQLGRYYVRYVNSNYNRTGTLWEGRFKSTIVDSNRYMLKLYQYIENNPVRAGIVETPDRYPWSSYHHNAGNKNISLVTPHPLYLALGDSEVTRKHAYMSLFNTDLDEADLTNIRNATNKAWALADERFLEQIKTQINRKPLPSKRGGDHRSKR